MNSIDLNVVELRKRSKSKLTLRNDLNRILSEHETDRFVSNRKKQEKHLQFAEDFVCLFVERQEPKRQCYFYQNESNK